LIEALLAGLFGLLIGSFLNVCIYRLPLDLSVVRPRSYCPACEHGIAWFDNIPLVSFTLLRARCRHCGAAIPFRYPAVELLTGLMFFAAVRALGPMLPALRLCIFSAIMIELIFSDLEERILPDEFTIGGAVVGLILAAFIPLPGEFLRFIVGSAHRVWYLGVAEAAFAGIFSATALWLVGTFYAKIRHREGLGLGDVKMVATIGAFLGLQGVLLTMILGSTLGAVVGLGYILIAKKDAATYEIPFGTFLGIAALVVAVYGELVLGWYSRLGA
jgi:leader peptidase (prepilin peptidase)/N-methyltransferase